MYAKPAQIRAEKISCIRCISALSPAVRPLLTASIFAAGRFTMLTVASAMMTALSLLFKVTYIDKREFNRPEKNRKGESSHHPLRACSPMIAPADQQERLSPGRRLHSGVRRFSFGSH
jgi:hypothetical protein